MNFPKFIKNQKGSLAVMIVGLILVSVFIYGILALLQNSRNQVTSSSRVEARNAAINRNLSLLRNSYIFNYSIENYNTADSNVKLKDCLLSSQAKSDDCKGVEIQFYQPSSDGGKRFAGSKENPYYSDYDGEDCLGEDGKPSSRCTLITSSACKFECPNEQEYCPLAKVVVCDLEVASYGINHFKTFTFSERNPVFATRFAIKISGDLKTFFTNE